MRFYWLISQQNKSPTDGFMLTIKLIYVMCITYFPNSQRGFVVCLGCDEYSCVELGKILGICKNSCARVTTRQGASVTRVLMLKRLSRRYVFDLFAFFTGNSRRHHGVRFYRIKIKVGYSGWE